MSGSDSMTTADRKGPVEMVGETDQDVTFPQGDGSTGGSAPAVVPATPSDTDPEHPAKLDAPPVPDLVDDVETTVSAAPGPAEPVISQDPDAVASATRSPEEGGPGRIRAVAGRLAAPFIGFVRLVRARVARGLSPRGRRTTLVGLCGLTVAVAVAVGLFGWATVANAGIENAGREAIKAAQTKVPIILSYHAATLADDLGHAREQTTGHFAEQYDQIASSVISPATVDQQINTTATVSRAGIIGATPDQVETLLFINQSTTSKTKPTAEVNTTQARVTLSLTAGQWLVSDVQPL